MQNLISSFRSSEMIKYNEIDIIKKTKTFKNLDFFQKIVVDKQNTIVLFASEFQMIRATDPLNVQAFADGCFTVPAKWYQFLGLARFRFSNKDIYSMLLLSPKQ